MTAWRWEYAIEIFPQLLIATGNTLLAVIIGYAIALPVGLIFAVAQRTGFQPLSFLVRELVDLLRSTPLLLQVFFLFYAGPQFGLELSPWVAGMTAIGLHYAAYLSEVYRAALDSVPASQWEACRALNLGAVHTYCRIILPQAMVPSIPAFGNYLISMFKDTPILSVIGVTELLHRANELGTITYRFLEPYTIVGAIFLALSLFFALLVMIFDRWVRRYFEMN